MEKSSFVIDSSVFIAFYHDDEEDHAVALDIIENLKNHIIVLHPYAIQEVTTVLTYRFGVPMALSFLSDIPRADNVFIPGIHTSCRF